WVWIDTCCINKRSSVELSETINSMYRWYQNAQVTVSKDSASFTQRTISDSKTNGVSRLSQSYRMERLHVSSYINGAVRQRTTKNETIWTNKLNVTDPCICFPCTAGLLKVRREGITRQCIRKLSRYFSLNRYAYSETSHANVSVSTKAARVPTNKTAVAAC
ncbi:hypothetical protein BKA83DRAFT_4054190, partial [Pisolithus microcarpus]